MAVGTTTSVKHNLKAEATEGESRGHLDKHQVRGTQADSRPGRAAHHREEATEATPGGYRGESYVQIDRQVSTDHGASEASRGANAHVTESGATGDDEQAAGDRPATDTPTEEKEPAVESATSSTVVCGGGCVAATQRAAAGKCPACECPAAGCPCTKCGCPLCGPTQTASTPLPCRGGDDARARATAGTCPACGCPASKCPCTNCVCPVCKST
ncbi:unnamed protein product [Hyaloperonospora brassicae]|uniref:Uncharacterized protein n=1 Tax=Hyaloperonospora brassicae TaxID=162125 RepID=A0AAV0V2P3_HYABA|nr:unnamed protein product [Hyaloperonospora brassicae]